MKRPESIIFAAALLVAGTANGSSFAGPPTTFQTYRCADGSEFIVGFFGYDPRAHLQVDGRAVTLAKRLALSGSRYSGAGITLKSTKAGTTLKRAKRPVTTCEVI